LRRIRKNEDTVEKVEIINYASPSYPSLHEQFNEESLPEVGSMTNNLPLSKSRK